MGRRGSLEKIFCDNGTDFYGAERVLRSELRNWNRQRVDTFMQQREIEWHRSLPLGSHFGGVWERLIRSARKILNAVLREQVLTDESLHTMMIEVEAILNARPLTPITMDSNDSLPIISFLANQR